MLYFLFYSLALADILPPGHVSVSFSVEIDNVNQFPDYEFWIGPELKGKYTPVVQGEGVYNIYTGHGAKLFAIPKGVTPTVDTKKIVAKYLPLDYSVPKSAEVTDIRAIVHITSVNQNQIVYEVETLKANIFKYKDKPVPNERGVSIKPAFGDEEWKRYQKGLHPYNEEQEGTQNVATEKSSGFIWLALAVMGLFFGGIWLRTKRG